MKERNYFFYSKRAFTWCKNVIEDKWATPCHVGNATVKLTK